MNPWAHKADEALHEAGHCLMAYLHNRDFALVSIKPIDGRVGGAIFYRAGNPEAQLRNHVPIPKASKPTQDPEQRALTERHIAISFGGLAAEILAGNRLEAIHFQFDVERIEALLTRLSSDPQERDRIAERLYTRTLETMKQEHNWARVQVLAALLLEQGEVTGAEAKDLFLRYLPPTRRAPAGLCGKLQHRLWGAPQP